MTLPLILNDEAIADLVSAAKWCEQQGHGLGAALTEAVQDVLERIEQGPENLPIVLRNTRMALVKPFPYCVYYRIEADQIRVLAIIHAKRSPRVWKSRI